MAWWARLKGSALLETSAPQMRVELIPGQLAVQVSQHELPVPGRSLACWTFQSAGPMARGQKELVLTIARGEGERVEAVGAEIVKLLGTIWKLAGEGRIIAIGGFSEFGPPGILGEVRGIGYLRAQEMPGVAVPNAALAVVPLVAEEVDTVIWPHAGRRAPRPALQLLPLAAVVGPWSGGRWRGRRRRGQHAREGASGDHSRLVRLRGVSRWQGRIPPVLSSPAVLRGRRGPGPRCGSARFGLRHRARARPGCGRSHGVAAGSGRPDRHHAPRERGPALSVRFVMIVPQQAADSLVAFEYGTSLLLRDASWDLVSATRWCAGSRAYASRPTTRR